MMTLNQMPKPIIARIHGIATAAGKAAFWDIVGAPESLKVLGIEGEFAMTSGHSQEMKTQAVAQQVGKRLRILLGNILSYFKINAIVCALEHI